MIYYDYDNMRLVTTCELRADYDQLKTDGQIDNDDFESYIDDCLICNSGALQPLHGIEATDLLKTYNKLAQFLEQQ